MQERYLLFMAELLWLSLNEHDGRKWMVGLKLPISKRENKEIGRVVKVCHHGNRYALERVNISSSWVLHMARQMDGLSRNRAQGKLQKKAGNMYQKLAS